MAKITYINKETIIPQPSVAAKNKVTSDDMNEIKQVVNANDDIVGDLSNLNTTDKSSIVNAINEVAQGTSIQVLNQTSQSTTDTYSANYVNNNFQAKGKIDNLISNSVQGADKTTTLLHPYTDYDLIIVTWGPFNASTSGGILSIPVSVLTTNSSIVFEDEDYQNDSVKKVVNVNFPTTSSIRLRSVFTQAWGHETTTLISVVGIKL